jgi:predicted nuclease of predicted toxin-antitoxin system
MKLLLDHDVYAATLRFLKDKGHDAVSVAALGLQEAADEDLLRTAQEQKRIFITRDRDYGSLVFIKAIGAGVLYLRMLPATQETVHKELENVLKIYSEAELMKAFIVVEADGHRIRKVASPNEK